MKPQKPTARKPREWWIVTQRGRIRSAHPDHLVDEAAREFRIAKIFDPDSECIHVREVTPKRRRSSK